MDEKSILGNYDSVYFNYIYDKTLQIFKANGCQVDKIKLVYYPIPQPMLPYHRQFIILVSDPKYYRYGQFLYQLSHELSHLYIDLGEKCPPKIGWFDEFLAMNLSFVIMKYFYPETFYDFKEYNQQINDSKIITIDFLSEYISANMQEYEKDRYRIYNSKETECVRIAFDYPEIINIWKLMQLFKTAVSKADLKNQDLDMYDIKEIMLTLDETFPNEVDFINKML